MSYQKLPFLGRLVLLTLLIAAPVSVAFAPLAIAAPAQAARLPVSLPAEVTNDGTVRIDGSSSMTAINQLLQQRYQEQYPDLRVEIEQHGTEAALKALLQGEVDLAAIGRSLTLAEKAQGLVEIPVSQEKIAIIVGRENPFRGSLTIDQLAKIFRGEITNWSEVGGPDTRIRVIDRPETSDTRLALTQYGLLEELRRLPLNQADRVRLDTDDTAEVIQALGTDGIGYAIVDQVQDQAQVRLVRIAVLQDSLPDSKLYPYVFSRSYAYKATLNPEIQSFIGFATAKPGQEAVTAAKRNEAKAILSTLAAATQPPAIVPPIAEIEQPAAIETVPVPSNLIPSKSVPTEPSITPPVETPEDSLTEAAAAAKEDLTETTQTLKDQVQDKVADATESIEKTPAEIAEDTQKTLTENAEVVEDQVAETVQTVKEKIAPTPTVITSIPSGRVIAQPELNQQYFDDSPQIKAPEVKTPEVKAPIVVEKPARVIEKPSDETGVLRSPTIVEKPTRIIERLDESQQVEPPVATEKPQQPAEPPSPEIPATEIPAPETVDQVKETDRRLPVWYWWLLLPLALVGLVFRWLNSRRAKLNRKPQTKPEATPETTAAVPPIAEAPVTQDSIQSTAVAPVETVAPADISGSIEPVVESLAEPEGIAETITPEPEGPVESATAAISEEVEEVDTAATVESFNEPPEEALIEAAIETTIVPEPVAEPVAEPAAASGVESPELTTLPQPIASVADAVGADAVGADEVMTPVPRDDSEPTIETFKSTFVSYLQGYLGKTPETATLQESYTALAYLVRDRILKLNRPEVYLQQPGVRVVGEIAAEYMPGPHLINNLINLGYLEQVRQAMRELGLDLDDLAAQEEEPGLGKGGLGRLMVCYLDSLSTAEIPAIGYGIRYEYGIFDQEIKDGWQVEVPDSWLQNGNPWELELPEAAVEVQFGGQTQAFIDDQGRYRVRWVPAEVITGIPYDTPILGYRARTVNPMRLWKAENSDHLCKVLYPVDMEIRGKALRLKQQFFLVSCALQDALRLHTLHGGSPATLHERFALQINDTDPTLSVAELMRLLVDEYGIDWEQAWAATQATLSYTNHSLMPETLDDLWTVGVFAHFLPRHLEIIFEINYRFLQEVQVKYSNDADRLQRLSLIDEGGDRYVRTTYLACLGSHAINGISKLHTQLLERTILRDFYELYPEKFSNKTNGITPRRFLLLTNPRLANLITREIGEGWITNLDELKRLEGFINNAQFRREWQQIKQANKQDLAAYIQQQTGIEVDVNSLFDIHTMRIHEYMRKHLQVLHILTLYNRIKGNPNLDLTPRTFIFGGKAAPDYFTAKLIIKLIHSVAELVNLDPEVRGRLKVVFLPDYNLKVAQKIYPAADVVEYISTAGTEACSTGNMIFAANGATIVGTLDGSNIELRDAVGAENFFSFGLTAQEVVDLRSQGYKPLDYYNTNPDLKAAIDLVSSGALSNGDTELFRPLVNLLLDHDYYMLLADYQSFLECQERVSQAYRNPEQWTQRSMLNAARIGVFSSDRAIAEYSRDIWNVRPVNDRLRQFTQPQAG